MAILKSKKFYFILGIFIVGAIVFYFQFKKKSEVPKYETIKAGRGDLIQTVEATGKVESLNDLSLRFEMAGVVEKVNAIEGKSAKAGELLANLKLSELNAAVAQAQANLNQKLAGATQAEKDYYKAVLDGAEADLENSQIVYGAYEDAVSVLQASLVKLDDGLVQSDAILGIDNVSINDDFQNHLSASDPSKLGLASSEYLNVKNLIAQVRETVILLNGSSPQKEVEAALMKDVLAYKELNQLLINVGDVLNATPIGINLSQTSLSSKKTTIDTTRTSVNTQYTNLINARQAIVDAKVSLKIKEALYNQALANYKNKINPPREVDVAALRAALSQAKANRDKAIIRAPIDGIITSINKKTGEFIASTDEMIRMFSPRYEIKVDIPETDIAKLQIGNTTTLTLDAFGDEIKFIGRVVNMEPGSTDIQDVVYYKVTITLGDTDKPVKPGMTANVKISTDSRIGALAVPLRAVRTNEFKYVKVLKNGEVQDLKVNLGMRADDGRVEVLGGLSEGDEVIIGTK